MKNFNYIMSIVLSCSFVSLHAGFPYVEKEEVEPQERRKELIMELGDAPLNDVTPEKLRGYLRKVGSDARDITRNIFRFTTLKVVTGVLPFYLITRQADAAIHRQFYNAELHQNKNQPPKFLRRFFDDALMAVPFMGFGIMGLAHKSPFERRAAQLFATGLIISWGTKILLKEFKTDSGLRPWHENFDAHERSHGGNPSGHSTMAAFMATYWGLYRGRSYGVPLGLFTALIMSIGVTANHHYASQVVAGAGLGVMFGFSAYRVLEDIEADWPISKGISLGFDRDSRGNPAAVIAYSF